MSSFMTKIVSTSWKRITVRANVSNNPVAQLMYYFNCVCTVLNLDHVENRNRLKDYKQYHDLTSEEIDNLVDLCNKYNPDDVKWFFEEEKLCVEFSNEFYEVDQNNAHLAALHERIGNLSRTVIIAGHSSKVVKLMVYKKSWLKETFTTPMAILRPWLEAYQENKPRPARECGIKVLPRNPFPESGKFSDNIAANILISYFCPLWIFAWIIMSILQA